MLKGYTGSLLCLLALSGLLSLTSAQGRRGGLRGRYGGGSRPPPQPPIEESQGAGYNSGSQGGLEPIGDVSKYPETRYEGGTKHGPDGADAGLKEGEGDIGSQGGGYNGGGGGGFNQGGGAGGDGFNQGGAAGGDGFNQGGGEVGSQGGGYNAGGGSSGGGFDQGAHGGGDGFNQGGDIGKGEGKEYVPPADDPSAGEDYAEAGAAGGQSGGQSGGGYNGGSFGGGENQYDDSGKQEGGGGGTVGGDCTCVPYYQCKDGNIITDGSGIIDPRKKPQPKEELPLEDQLTPPFCGKYHVCCSHPSSSVTEKPYEHYCGIRKPNGLNAKVLSSKKTGESQFGEWPWQAAILKVEGEANHFQCGAVLIDEDHVLTVAHCVAKFLEYSPLPLVVRLGEWDTQTKEEFLPHEDYSVSYVIIHPEFKNSSLWNDVAVLKLDRPVKYAAHIDTICLPNYGEKFEGQECVVTGWGKDAYRHGHYSNILREVHVPVITSRKCQEQLRKTRLGHYFRLHDGFLCAGGQENEDSCKGDGGGPLTCYRPDGTYALAGLVSWGIDCGMPHVPGVYIDVSKYLDWIKESTGKPLENYWPRA